METNIVLFYGWWQFATCLFAFIALMAIWWHIGKKQNDLGQVWLALSIVCWSLSGLTEVYFAKSNATSVFLAEGFRSILSLFNSLLILLALPWFRYLPKPIAHLIKSPYWIYIVGIPFVFSLLPTLHKMINQKAFVLISELDVYYAVLTLLFLGCVLWESFVKRRLKILAWLSLATILITLIAQFYKLSNGSINEILFSAIFKTTLIMLFFALALSWVKELIENIIPDRERLHIQFHNKTTTSGKIQYTIFLKGFPSKDTREVILTPALYELFLKFAKAKIYHDDDWLEIKPKNYTSKKTYDINDYNEIKRLLVAILDNIFGKGNWTKDTHLIPLKTTLFEMSEKRERKIRLGLSKIQIHL
ncbi:hypothetical protein ACE939_08950 [Aquimarina sp. W85]|uniref:hypothetical protein n=1 Tax=Aquimarina rhodophyticola TaxID=3342246 RepID=UPI00366C2E7B